MSAAGPRGGDGGSGHGGARVEIGPDALAAGIASAIRTARASTEALVHEGAHPAAAGMISP
jgi:hypothetical protein